MINGKRIGFALGSGGARGIAHIGVLQVLEEQGILPDMISGCSAGAIVGAIYAAGTNLYLLERLVDTMPTLRLVDVSYPGKGGFINGDKIKEIVQTLTHNKTFAQTRIPFFCTATDLCSGEQKLFSQGNIADAVRASISVPGVFTPVELDGCWYADGGILEELPVSCLRQQGADIILCSDLSIKQNRFEGEKSNALDVLRRSFSIMQAKMTADQKDKGDVLIRPDASFMKLISTDNTELSVQAGRKAAQEALPEIRQLLGR